MINNIDWQYHIIVLGFTIVFFEKNENFWENFQICNVFHRKPDFMDEISLPYVLETLKRLWYYTVTIIHLFKTYVIESKIILILLLLFSVWYLLNNSANEVFQKGMTDVYFLVSVIVAYDWSGL